MIDRLRESLRRQQKARDSGAVAIEFALIFPALILMIAGIFGIGVVMIQDLQLNFVVEGASKVEAHSPGSGAAWASAQLTSASFSADPSAACGAQVTGQWPVSLGVFPRLTLSAQACSPK